MTLLARFQPIVYVRLTPDLLSVRDVRSARTIAEPPLVAISREPRKRVLGTGEAARAAAAAQPADVVNPFGHPRTLISDFTVAEVLLKDVLKKLFHGRLFVPSPAVVIHPRGKSEGGFTQVELRAFRELAVAAGASLVYLCLKDTELTDAELLELRGTRPVV